MISLPLTLDLTFFILDSIVPTMDIVNDTNLKREDVGSPKTVITPKGLLEDVGSPKAVITSKGLLYAKGGNDECYTPDYAVRPILKYLPKDKVVWCPFDKKDSAFVRLISETHKVIHSHLEDGQDFYSYEPAEHWDVIVSNPPFTNKKGIFTRALSFGKPFALLMNVVWLNDTSSKLVFANAGRQMQLCLLDKRVKFLNNENKPNNKITFNSSYFCADFLPRDIVIEKLSDVVLLDLLERKSRKVRLTK